MSGLKNKRITQDNITLQECLRDMTGCSCQNSNPCNTCFHNLDLGVSDDITHLLWIVHLCMRADKDYTEESVIKANIPFLRELIKKCQD
jgi:hypothetical protein